jgi:hypothetical protein
MKRPVAVLAALVAAGVTSQAGAMSFDQLHCRRVRDDAPKRRVRTELVARDPVFGSATGCILKLPARYLCDGSALAGTTPDTPGVVAGAQAQRYLCYRARCDDGGQTLTLHDQFGERAVEVKSSRLVCAPAHLVEGGSTTSTTAPPDSTTSTTAAPDSTTSTTVAPATTTSTTMGPASTTSTTMAPPATTSTTLAPASTTSTTAPPPTTSTSLPATTSTTSVPPSTTTTTTLGGPQPPSPGCPVVNEVMTGGASSASEEFVELVNPCGHALELAGARLLYRSSTGGTERVLASWDAGRVLAAGGRLVYATSLFPGPSDGVFVAGMAAAGGGVGIVDAAGGLVDAVGWGTAANGFVETTAAAAPAAGSVIARLPDGVDTDDNAADFEQASPTPGSVN